jgi:CRP-like cAMP-binding protein
MKSRTLPAVPPGVGNLFLSSLSPESRERLVSASIAVTLPVKTLLYEANEIPHFAYFLRSGLASVVTPLAEGDSAEVGFIGREGVIGSLHLLGPAVLPTRCVMQLEGTAFRISLAALQNAFDSSPEVRRGILKFVQEQAATTNQIAGCNRLHDIQQRLARWLLMAQDRTKADSLHFTQEYLSEMIGSRRTTITTVAGNMQRQGIIEYQRGHIKILNRAGLESAACDCYRVIRELYANLYKQN